MLSLAIAVIVGLAIGIGIALLRSLYDTRIHGAAEASALTHAPVLGTVPTHRARGNKHSMAAMDIWSDASEAYRRLRTNVRVLGLSGPRKSIVVSSALPGEGKTVIVANLGIAFAQAGYRVALVDANLRNPDLARVLGVPSTKGLTDVLSRKMTLVDALQPWEEGRSLPLSILACGRPPVNPSELLGSEAFISVLAELEQMHDVVIVDSSSLLPFTDAAILAQMTHGIVLVTRVGWTRSDQVSSAVEELRLMDAPIIGVVLNRSSEGAVATTAKAARPNEHPPERAPVTPV